MSTLALGMTTTGRRERYPFESIGYMRRAGFDQTLHVFAEPNSHDLSECENTVVHWNDRQLGCFPNFKRGLIWMVENTDEDWIMMLQDDVAWRKQAAVRVQHGIDTLPARQIGFISPYAGAAMVPRPAPKAPRWVDARFHGGRGKAFWGALTICMPRRSAEMLLDNDRFQRHAHHRKVDVIVGNCFRKELGMRILVHVNSQADHLGKKSSIGRDKIKGTSWGRRGFRISREDYA